MYLTGGDAILASARRSPRVRALITGGTGMIGTALADALRQRGDEVVVLTRGEVTGEGMIQWDPARGVPQPKRLANTDVVFNLTGAPLATRPWTRARRAILKNSRIQATESLLRSLGKNDGPPPVYVGVGHLGLFGDRGTNWIDDEDTPGTGFLSELSVAWEAAHLAAADVIGSRTAVLRMSIVLTAKGGVFPLMVAPFRHGFGGWLGDGKQYTSWLSLQDAVRALLHLADTPSCTGAFNGGVPDPCRNADWCRALGNALDKPVRTHAPKWALRGALGELADAVLLSSVRARPTKLLDSGFEFVDTDVEALFRRLVSEL